MKNYADKITVEMKERWEAELDLFNKMDALMVECTQKELEVACLKYLSARLEVHKNTYQIAYRVNDEMSDLQNDIYKIKDKLADLEEIAIHRFDNGYLRKYSTECKRYKTLVEGLEKYSYISQEDKNYHLGQLAKYESNIS